MEKQQFDQQSQLPQQPIYDQQQQQQPPQYQQQQQFQQQPQYQPHQATPPQYSQQQQQQYNQQQQQPQYNQQQQPQYNQQQQQQYHQQQQPQYNQQQPHYQQQGPPQPQYHQQQPQYGHPQQQQPYRQQPVTQQPGPIGAGGWKNHLCGCFNNFQIAITTFLLPFVTFGTTAELVGEGNCILCAAAFFVPGFNCYEWLKIRGKIREMKGIPGSTGTDCAVIFFLPYCALVQEAQEVDPLSVPSALSMSRA